MQFSPLSHHFNSQRLGRLSKESVQVRCSICFFVTRLFLRWGVISPTPNPQAGGPPIVLCPRLLIQFIRMPWWQGTHLTWDVA
jgi:hypothetical protein